MTSKNVGMPVQDKGTVPWPDMPDGPVSLLSKAGRARLSMIAAMRDEEVKAAARVRKQRSKVLALPGDLKA